MIRKTPAQASCPVLVGLIANLKMVTGRLAIGSFRLVVQNWLLSAVNNSGAVRRKCARHSQQDAGDHAGAAAFSVIIRITFHFGVPSAYAASRSVRAPG